MPADAICRVILPSGQPCGYAPEGDTAQAKIRLLFTHELSAHVPGKSEKLAAYVSKHPELAVAVDE